MYNYHNKKKFIWSVFLILLLVIGIGYAYLTSNLSISGNTQVTTNTWNIHFENLNVSTGSISTSSPATINAAGDAITYTIDLNRPKEYYEFTVDVKNDGTLPGKVSISNISGITTEASSIIDYSVTYTNGNPVNMGDILNAGAKKSIKVRVFYKDEIDPSDFPADDLNLTLTYTLQYVQSEEDEMTVGNLLQKLVSTNSCITKYEGQVTDQVGETVTASNVYFDNCSDKRNLIFAGTCWEIIRTTETGGLKILYNGQPVDGKCESSRSNQPALHGNDATIQNLNANYKYGDSITYDLSTGIITLNNALSSTWSDSTYENLLGKYTCLSTTDTCNEVYYVHSYYSETSAYTSKNRVANIPYYLAGRTAYNANPYSMSMVGYMFNKSYDAYRKDSISGNYMVGNNFTYNENTNTYTLSGTTAVIDWESEYGTIETKKYTCWNTSGMCNTLSYLIDIGYNYSNYIDLNDGKNITDIINEMLFADDVNTRNSSIKAIIDNWYFHNLTPYTNNLEDIVFCNNRSITSYGSWDINYVSSFGGTLYFKNGYTNNDLTCENITDQFAISNNKAKLKYPVALVSLEEVSNTTLSNRIGWSISPYSYSARNSIIKTATYDNITVHLQGGFRPSISLNESNSITEGDGTETDPWIIDD